MTRVMLVHHSYERYAVPGDRGSLKEHRKGDVFEADGPELERLLDLDAVVEVGSEYETKVSERTRAEYELAVKRHELAKSEHETLASEPNQAPMTIERSLMNVEALRGERDRLGRLARRSDDQLAQDPAEAKAAADAEAAAKAAGSAGAKTVAK